jgi:hypothetical protein
MLSRQEGTSLAGCVLLHRGWIASMTRRQKEIHLTRLGKTCDGLELSNGNDGHALQSYHQVYVRWK